MKYLIINYYWEPMVDAHAYRWSQLVRELVAKGHSVEVITSKFESLKPIEEMKGISIKRIGIFTSKNRTETVASVANNKSKIELLLKRQLELLRKTYKSIHWPDPFWHWLPSLLIELYRRRNISYDYMVSYYPCFAAHIGGLFFKNISNRGVVSWIADYGDPFSVSLEWPPNNFTLYREINIWIERKIFLSADTFSVMNVETKRRYEALFGGSTKLVVVPHLAPKILPVRSFAKTNTVVLRYIGSFHQQVRDHHLLFELASILASSKKIKYQIEIYGPTDYWAYIDIPVNVKICGKVSRDAALRLLSSADILINVNNNTELMTPSKIIEYIATRRPIVNIGKCGYEALERYSRYGMCFNFYGLTSCASLFEIENYIQEARSRTILSDRELDICLAGHSADEILSTYGILQND